jgi:hypothetical protein
VKLYPLLARSPSVDRLVVELMGLEVGECRNRRSLKHDEQVVSPTGGVPAVDSDLQAIVAGLTTIAERYGYPEPGRDNGASDAEWSEFLHREMQITPHEAANDDLWHFFTCVLAPDLTRWRWNIEPADKPSDRWITVSHRGRNCFGRLWWRCEALKLPTEENPYTLIHQLKEDEFVQLMERPWLASHGQLSRISAQVLLERDAVEPIPNRGRHFREMQKQLLRLGAFIEFGALDEGQLRMLVGDVFRRSRVEQPVSRRIRS